MGPKGDRKSTGNEKERFLNRHWAEREERTQRRWRQNVMSFLALLGCLELLEFAQFAWNSYSWTLSLYRNVG